jgi:hypothetical protein
MLLLVVLVLVLVLVALMAATMMMTMIIGMTTTAPAQHRGVGSSFIQWAIFAAR